MYDWNERRSPGDLVARLRDSPEPGANESPILGQNQRLLRREEADSSTVWLRWEGELASSSSSTTPSLSQSNHELQAGRPIEDIRRGDESLASGSTDARRMGVLTHGNPEFDFTPSGNRYPVLWEGAVVELDGTIFSVTAHQVSREREDSNPNLSKVMEQTGQILLEHCWGYIVDVSRCIKRRVTIHRILPRGRKDEINFARLFSGLYSRACAATILPTSRSITEAYVIPLGSGDIMPTCVSIVEGPEPGANALLAVFIRNRRKKRNNDSRSPSTFGVTKSNSSEKEAGEFLESLLIRPPVNDSSDSGVVGSLGEGNLESREEASVEEEMSEEDGNLSEDEREDDDSSTIELEDVIKQEALDLYDQEAEEDSEDPSRRNDSLAIIKEEDESEGNSDTSVGKDSLRNPGCSVVSFQNPFEDFIVYLTGEMGVDRVVAAKRANEAFAILNAEGLDFDKLKSFTAHQVEYGLSLSLGDATHAMRTLFKSKGIIKMWTIDGLLRKLAAHYFRILGVVLKDGLVWKSPDQLEVRNFGGTGGRGLLCNDTLQVEDETLSTDPEYMANRLEAEESIHGGGRRTRLIVETVPMVPKNRNKGPSSVTLLHDTGAVGTYCSWSCAYHHSTYVIKLRKPYAAVSINGSTKIQTAAKLHILTNQGICSFWALILEDIPVVHLPTELLIPTVILEKYRLKETYFDRISTEPCSLIIGMDMAAKLHPREVERTEEIVLYVSQITGMFLATGAYDRYRHHGFATALNILQDGDWNGIMEDVGPRSNPAPTYADHQLHVESRVSQSFDGETRRSEVPAGVRGLRGCEISDEMKFFYNNSAKYGAFWEFARDLLRMEEFNPSILRWEHQEAGLFRVVSKAGLGKLWSLVKGNLTQDYGRIRMVLREYRGQEKIDIVNTTSLLYRFGPKAIGWDWRPDEYGDQVRLVGQKVRCRKCLCLFPSYLQLERHRSRLCAGQLVPPLKAGWSLVPEGEQRLGDWERLGSFYREDSPEYEPQPLFPGSVNTVDREREHATTSFPRPSSGDIDLDGLDSVNYVGSGGLRQGSAIFEEVIEIEDVPSPGSGPGDETGMARPSLQQTRDLTCDLPIDLSRKSERAEDAAFSLLNVIIPPREASKEKPEYSRWSGGVTVVPTFRKRPVTLGTRGEHHERIAANSSHERIRGGYEGRPGPEGGSGVGVNLQPVIRESAKYMKCFLKSILGHPSTNPSIIKWSSDEENGFRISSWPEIFHNWGKHATVDVQFETFMRVIEDCVRIGSIVPIRRRPRCYRFGKRTGLEGVGDSRPGLNQGTAIAVPEHAPSSEEMGDPSTGSGLMENFGEMVLKYSGFPENPVSKVGGCKGGQTGLNLELSQGKLNELTQVEPIPPPTKRRRSNAKGRGSKNPSEVVPRAILPRLPGVVEEHFTEYSAKVLLPMDRRKKAHLMVSGVTMHLEPYLFSHFPRTNSGQPGWVLAPPPVAATGHEQLLGPEQMTADHRNQEVVPGKIRLIGENSTVEGASLPDWEEWKIRLIGGKSTVEGASLPDWEESKKVEVTVENPDWEEFKEVEVIVEGPPTHAEVLEPKPELLRTEVDCEGMSVSGVPDYCQEIEVKHEDVEKPLCPPVTSEDQDWSGLITTHFEVKEEDLEQPTEGLRQGSDSRVVRLPRVELSAEAEEFIQDHPRLTMLRSLKEGDSAVPEPAWGGWSGH